MLRGEVRYRYLRFSPFVAAAVCVIFLSDIAYAADVMPAAGKILMDKYRRIEAKLADNSFGIPVYLESSEEHNTLSVDVYGIVEYPFAAVRNILQTPENWCDIAPLHINIKACTYRNADNETFLTFYSGRKFYQPPGDAYQLRYAYRVNARYPEYTDISLLADKGPLNTRDHRLEFEAVSLHSGKTLAHFKYSYSYGMLGRIAMKSYFATLGRNKIGFSIVDADNQGNPVYVDGVKGAIERNAVRYYLAIQAYMDTIKAPDEQRFEKCLNRWYDLTNRFQKQLYEMDREEYLSSKRREHENQLALQNEPDRYHAKSHKGGAVSPDM
jgi:hypothetical protein